MIKFRLKQGRLTALVKKGKLYLVNCFNCRKSYREGTLYYCGALKKFSCSKCHTVLVDMHGSSLGEGGECYHHPVEQVIEEGAGGAR